MQRGTVGRDGAIIAGLVGNVNGAARCPTKQTTGPITRETNRRVT